MTQRTTSTATADVVGRLVIAVVLATALALGACQCGPDAGVAPGEACDEEGERDGDLICEDGEWVHADSDVGFDVDDCEAESSQEFCERHEVECGSFEGEDNCGDERSVTCEEFDGIGCEDIEICLHAEDDDDLDTNVCACPELGDSPGNQICDHAGAECGTVDAGEVCQDWEDLGDVDCGECEGDDECGEEIDNICGCPCDIDGQCYTIGESDPDEECMICDPDESDEDFTAADDGTECQEAGVCEDGECVCEDDDAICDDECVDLDSNRDHCGECDNECGDDEICDDGECAESCPDDEAMCDGECVDIDSDMDHCGECNAECSAGDDATASCEDGDCIIECDDDDDTVCDDQCVDTDSDPDHCGDCGEECTTDIDGAEATCEGGDCDVECADDDDELCEDEGLCTNLDEDHDNCGECGNECDGVNEFCNVGNCESFTGSCDDNDDCATGEQCCDEVCIPAAAPC